jgi:hypothetical protein
MPFSPGTQSAVVVQIGEDPVTSCKTGVKPSTRHVAVGVDVIARGVLL